MAPSGSSQRRLVGAVVDRDDPEEPVDVIYGRPEVVIGGFTMGCAGCVVIGGLTPCLLDLPLVVRKITVTIIGTR